ncbi:MAG: hypothetical protein ACK5LV_08700 [Lachnospirales bacterium]
MMNILIFILSALKFIFLALLTIIGIILLLVIIILLIVLYTPIKHKIVARYCDDDLYFHANVNVFFKLVKLDIYYKDKKVIIKHNFEKDEGANKHGEDESKRISKEVTKEKGTDGHYTDDNRDKATSSEEKSDKLHTESSEQPKDEKTRESRGESSTEKLERKRFDGPKGSEHSQKSSSSDSSGEDGNKHRESSTKLGTDTKEVQYDAERIRDKIVKYIKKGLSKCSEFYKKYIKPKIIKYLGLEREEETVAPPLPKGVNDVIDDVEVTILKYFNILECYTSPKIRKYLKKVIINVFKIFEMDNTVFDGTFGKADNPESVGKALAAFYAIEGAMNLKHFNLVGDFENDIVDVDLYTNGVVKLHTIVNPTLCLGFHVALATKKALKFRFRDTFKIISGKKKLSF